MAIELDYTCFPHLREEGFLTVPKESTFGRAVGDLFYNEDADYLITCQSGMMNMLKRTLKTKDPTRLIVDFYMWDYGLNKFRLKDDYLKWLNQLSSIGIDKCVGMDFSLWYGQPEPTLINNLYLNMLRLKQAQDHGFKTLFNWNNIMVKFMDIYREIFPPRIPVIMIDKNHGEYDVKTAKKDRESLKQILDFVEIDLFVIQTNRQKLDYLSSFLKLAEDHGVSHRVVSAQTMIFGRVAQVQRKKKGMNRIHGVDT